jgi:hypothetical protein
MLRNYIPGKYLLVSLMSFYSCTTVKVAVPESFGNKATSMEVKGLNGWMIKQKLTFGNYTTSPIKRGWDFSRSASHTKFLLRPEEALIKVFNVDTYKGRNQQRHNFNYTIEDESSFAEIFATEKFSEKELLYKSNNPWIGDASKTLKYEYAFTAAILPLKEKKAPWSLVLINRYDVNKNSTGKVFDKPYIEEEGYATDGNQNIAIRPLRLENVKTKDNKDVKVFGGPILSGYELQMNNSPVGLIDILDNRIWMSNDLDASTRLIVASVSSAILLKRMQDVEKDKGEIND